MFKIGILGSENSHAKAFAEIFNKSQQDRYPDMRVTAIGGNNLNASKRIFDEFGLEILAEKPEDMLGKVDAIMITTRSGKLHPFLAKPFIKEGIPAFIDKPFASDAKEAVKLAKLAKECHVPLCGGSAVQYAYDVLMMKSIANAAKKAGEVISGDITAPLKMNNEYGGFCFYAPHLASMTLTVFGSDPVSVTASRSGDDVTAIVHYENFDVTNHFLNEKMQYTITLNRKERPIFVEVDIGMIYQHECAAFADMLRTGKMEHTYEELVLPVCYINAVEKSYRTGKTCEIKKPVI